MFRSHGLTPNTRVPARVPFAGGRAATVLTVVLAIIAPIAALLVVASPASASTSDLTETSAPSAASDANGNKCTVQLIKYPRDGQIDEWSVGLYCSSLAPGIEARGVLDRTAAADYDTGWIRAAGGYESPKTSSLFDLEGPAVRVEYRNWGWGARDCYLEPAAHDWTRHNKVEFVNSTGEPVTLETQAPAYNFDGGYLRSAEHNGVPAMPGGAVTLAPGQSLAFATSVTRTQSSSNHFGGAYAGWFNATIAGPDGQFFQPVLRLAGELECPSKNGTSGDTWWSTVGFAASDPLPNASYGVTIEELGAASGFDWTYRVAITEANTPVLDIPSIEQTKAAVRIDRLSGSAISNPVYKVGIDGFSATYTTLPSEISVPTYTVRGKDSAGTWHALGSVVPKGRPVIDHAAKTITFGPAEFWWENTTALSVTELGVSGYPFHATEPVLVDPNEGRLCVPDSAADAQLVPVPPPCEPSYWIPATVVHSPAHERVLTLTSATAPPADLSQQSINTVGSSVSTGLPVTPNGVAQETLKVKLTNTHGETINPNDHPELARLYDYVHFRDAADGSLITGLYQPDGYVAVSTVAGPYVNSLSMSADEVDATASPAMKVYLSTTRNREVRVTAHLAVTRDQRQSQSSPTVVGAADLIATHSGTARNGVGVAGGLADPTVRGAFHHYNGTQPRAVLITGYRVATAATSLPLSAPFSGTLIVRDSGTYASLDSTNGLGDIVYLRTRVVNASGTWVDAQTLLA